MKFNTQLKEELKRYEKKVATTSSETTAPIREEDEQPTAPRLRFYRSEKVVCGDIKWKPIDRAAAMLLAKAHWLSQPPQVSTHTEKTQQKPKKQRKERKNMKGVVQESSGVVYSEKHTHNGTYISEKGIRVKMVNGEPFLDSDDVFRLLAEEAAKLPKETRPNVQAAEDARKIITELLQGIGGEMDKFKANSALYLQDIRGVRFAVVTETAQMTKELKEVRQFFLGSDYKEQIERLREFVDLCERLQKLKECGFLDSVADTMLRLSER